MFHGVSLPGGTEKSHENLSEGSLKLNEGVLKTKEYHCVLFATMIKFELQNNRLKTKNS
jgi:hypothetical protein